MIKKSIEEYGIYFSESLVSRLASKQKVVSRSSAKAKYRALALGFTKVILLRCVLRELKIQEAHTPAIFIDIINEKYLTGCQLCMLE